MYVILFKKIVKFDYFFCVPSVGGVFGHLAN